MIPVILAGLGIGIGLVLLIVGLFPAPLSLQGALDRLSTDPVTARLDVSTPGRGGLSRLAARVVETNVARVPRLAATVIPDLAITGVPVEAFAVKVVGYAITLALLFPVLYVVMGTVGIHLASSVPLVGVVLGAGAGTGLPFFDLAKAAEKRRRHFSHSLATYCSLVSMAMAGAMGWSSAMEAAASVSSGDWAMAEIARSLLAAQVYKTPPWDELDALATRFNVADLSDLARSMSQAGEGSRIRDTLDAKAQSLRGRETSALEDAAAAVTQKMLLPGVFLMLGYGVLIFYPALASFSGAHL